MVLTLVVAWTDRTDRRQIVHSWWTNITRQVVLACHDLPPLNTGMRARAVPRRLLEEMKCCRE